jgi:hypothetical protein
MMTFASAIDAAADASLMLINSKPRSPTKDELMGVLAAHLGPPTNVEAPTSAAALSPQHLAYRKIVAEIERYNDPDCTADDEETDAALSILQEQACELETEIWAKPAKTLADLLLRAEIALFNENGVMDSLGDNAAYYDDRANAQLIRAVIDVLGGANAL